MDRTHIDNLKDYASLIPFFGAYFILYGAVDLITYYREFNIGITNFIGFSEVISYFIKDIYIILAHVAAIFVGLFFSYLIKEMAFGDIEKNTVKWNDNLQKADDIVASIDKNNIKLEDKSRIAELELLSEQRKEELENADRRIKRIKVLLIIASILILLQVIGATYKFGLLMGLRFITPFAISATIIYFIKDFRLFFFVYALVSLITSAYFNAISHAENVVKGSNYGWNIDLDDEKLRSDSTNYIIGKTENFVFYYKSIEKETIIYPTRKIENITIPNR